MKAYGNFKLPAGSLAILGLMAVVCGCSGPSDQSKESVAAANAGEAPPPSVVLRPQDSDSLWVFAESKDKLGSGGAFRIYVDAVQFPQALASFAEFSLGVGGALPVHRHDNTEEIAYFISGEGTVTVYDGDQPREVPIGQGHVLYTPPSSWHAIENTGIEPLTLVFATIPNEENRLLSFFRRIGARPGHTPTQLSPEDFGRIAAEHDLILRPPDPE